MNTYVTSTTIRALREKRNLTQAELADRIGVSSKTISKWETAKGLPDVSLLQPLAQALNISLIELMNGEHIQHAGSPHSTDYLLFVGQQSVSIRV